MKIARILSLGGLVLLASPAFAHTGHMEHGLTDGLLHPVTGLDHLAMLLTSGVLAALTGRRLGLPLLTLLAMVAGTAIGFVFGSYSLVEPAILTSLLVAGALLLAPGRMTLLAWVMPAFALFHGWAHGVEAPAAQVTAFTLGAVLAASALLAVGYLMGRQLRAYPLLQKGWAGGVLTLAAAALAG